MHALTLGLLLQVAIGAAPETYAAAHQRTAETGEPLVVLVGTDWCPACRTMKQSVVPQARQNGLLDKVAFATINSDHEPKLAQSLMRGRSIPQLIMFTKTPQGWKRRQLTGAQGMDSLKQFIQQGVEESAPQVSEQSKSDSTLAGN